VLSSLIGFGINLRTGFLWFGVGIPGRLITFFG